MSDRSDRSVTELLQDIIHWGERIPALLGDQSFDEFRRDYRTHLAVWKSIEVIGEASGRLLKMELRTGGEMARQLRLAYEMRNRLTHGYPGVDLQILWNTARSSVPPLVEAARSVLSPDRGDGS